jgi:prepilin-type N-terminal cleavage/methylation domain-containing protein/prepilin-type processing-associated H-X9-DG protein
MMNRDRLHVLKFESSRREVLHWRILSPSRSAFTLIELLVVIAVISILAALLLPALARAKEKARSVQCLSNVKQWVLAFHMYKDDHEYIPREGNLRDGTVQLDNWADVASALNQDVWYNALPFYVSQPSARSCALLAERPKFYQNRIFHCPTAKFPPGVERDGAAFFSLVMNSKLIMPPASNPKISIRFDSIQKPSATAAFLEARVNDTEAKVDRIQIDTDLGQPSASASRFAIRHSRGGNVGFCDGHVERRPGQTVVETRAVPNRGFAIFPSHDLIWCANPFDDPDVPD